jgi:hypothetical protein
MILGSALLWLLGCGPPAEAGADLGELAVADGSIVRFAAVGDVGKGNEGERATARQVQATCRERGCDFVLLLGDNLYPRGMESPQDPKMDAVIGDIWGTLGLPVVMVLGNHDYGQGTDDARADWQLAWAARSRSIRMPSRFFGFTAGPASFAALDTTRAFWRGASDQAAWLDGWFARQTRPWTVVFGHHTWRSDGPHGNAGAYEGWPGIPFLSGAPVERLLDGHVCGHADLYLSGHDHTLQWLDGPCGGSIVVSGAGAGPTSIEDRGNHPRFAAAQLGFAWLSLGDTGAVAFIGDDGRELAAGELRRAKGGGF